MLSWGKRTAQEIHIHLCGLVRNKKIQWDSRAQPNTLANILKIEQGVSAFRKNKYIHKWQEQSGFFSGADRKLNKEILSKVNKRYYTHAGDTWRRRENWEVRALGAYAQALHWFREAHLRDWVPGKTQPWDQSLSKDRVGQVKQHNGSGDKSHQKSFWDRETVSNLSTVVRQTPVSHSNT